MSNSSAFGAPIPLSEIESVLAWVDTFKLSRPTKKINRDFSDAVLLAEILSVQYPKLVEMHNYPPRNSHALKLNNWMTLNRKVLKKIKLNLCINTMEQLANSVPGIIERVLVMVRDKIKRDEELEKSTRDAEQNVSSGGSYYEACGDEEHVLVVPVKVRVNGVLETIQQKVVTHDAYVAVKEELKDAKEVTDALKQKVDHLDSVIKLKEERIVELQKELERKQSRHKKFENLQNSLAVPFDDVPSPVVEKLVPLTAKVSSLTKVPSKQKIDEKPEVIDTKIPTPKTSASKITPQPTAQPSITEVTFSDIVNESQTEIDRISSNVFQEADLAAESLLDAEEEFADSEQDTIITIEDSIENEINDIVKPKEGDQVEMPKENND